MPNAVFVVPYALEATLKFVRAAARLPDVRLAILSQEPVDRLPADVRQQIAAHHRLKDCLDSAELVAGIQAAGRSLGSPITAAIAILEQLQEPLAKAREELGIPGMSEEASLNFRDKARMKTVLRQHGIPCAKHCLAESAEQAVAFSGECGLPLVAKPPAGSGGKNTYRLDDPEHLEQLLKTSPPRPESPMLLEEFIKGREHSFDSVTVAGRHAFHSISQYTPTPLEVMENPWIQWCVLLPRSIETGEFADIEDTGRRALECLGMQTGFTHMEWFRRSDGSLAISEVAARPPGAQFTSLISYAHDHDFYRAWSELLIRGTFQPPERKYAAGAVYLRGQGGGQVHKIHGLEQAQRELGELVIEARLPELHQAPSSSYEGEGYIILRHPQTEVVADGLQRLVRGIRVEMK